jgi:hypothetical protein
MAVDELDWLSNLRNDEYFLRRHAVCFYMCVTILFGMCL